MTQRNPDISNGVDDRSERLIVRALDGELSSAERVEFEALIAASPAAARLYRDYQRLDALAGAALHADFNAGVNTTYSVVTSASSHGHHWSKSMRVGVMTALLAAAAVIVLASLPIQWSDTRTANSNHDHPQSWPNDPVVTPASPTFIDYQRPVYQPQRLEGDVFRDVIGVQGENPNVILIIERLTRQSRVETVSGEI
ncbi:MAG TPA: hypothetical protein P5081_23980 [Phycisphaerae bacterium]|nr:hypothetical protein [Phycisphaerae bacterium]HRW55945.1 hypothetical protein [Phycisphaerae bacterium]